MKADTLRYEKEFLSKYATLSEKSKGRLIEETPCELRTEFQRDRDRIIHCKAFRRLKHKTQVFLSPTGDHYRTRLTHTLEVTQIARTISRALLLNEDLTEAIALGHDLGHTPFGHAGENVLNGLVGHFQHNEHSLRVVDILENEGKGLNLTFEVRDGILNHKSTGKPATLEGKIVSFADRIAYINHDISDAIRGGVIKEKDLPKSCVEVLGSSKRERIDTLVKDMITNSFDKPEIKLSEEKMHYMNELRKFMFDRVYYSEESMEMGKKADRMVSMLFNYYLKHPDELPCILKEYDITTNIVDYLASMTDIYAINMFTKKFIPEEFK